MNFDRIIFVGFQRKTFGTCKKKIKTLNLREDEEIWKREKILAEIWSCDEQFNSQNFYLESIKKKILKKFLKKKFFWFFFSQ